MRIYKTNFFFAFEKYWLIVFAFEKYRLTLCAFDKYRLTVFLFFFLFFFFFEKYRLTALPKLLVTFLRKYRYTVPSYVFFCTE